MENDDLDTLELDLRAVADRLGHERSWTALGPRVHRAMRRPQRALVKTLVSIVACAVAGFWAPIVWLTAAGLAMAVLPDRIRQVLLRRRTLEQIGDGDLFALYRQELTRRLASHFLSALASAALGLLFFLVAALARNPTAGLVVGTLCVVGAVVHLFWLLPRASRELRDLDGEGEKA